MFNLNSAIIPATLLLKTYRVFLKSQLCICQLTSQSITFLLHLLMYSCIVYCRWCIEEYGTVTVTYILLLNKLDQTLHIYMSSFLHIHTIFTKFSSDILLIVYFSRVVAGLLAGRE